MQKREKILAVIAAVLVGGTWGLPRLYQWVYGPVLDRQQRLATLQQQRSQRLQQAGSVNQAARQLALWRRRSLPPDALDAQRLYQEWLTEIALLCGWDSPRISPGRRLQRGKVYTAVQVTLEATVSLERLCRFLDLFHRVELAQRVAALRVQRSQDGSELQVSLTAEGLCLADAPQRKRLFAETQLAAPFSSSGSEQSLAVTSGQGFPEQGPFYVRIEHELLLVTEVQKNRWKVQGAQLGTRAASHPQGALVQHVPLGQEEPQQRSRLLEELVRTGPFSPPPPPQGNAPPPQQSAPSDDPAARVRFIASVSKNDVPEAWLYDAATGQRSVLTAGDKLAQGPVQGRVLEVRRDALVVQNEQGTWFLPLGSTLAQWQQVASPSGGEQPPSRSSALPLVAPEPERPST